MAETLYVANAGDESIAVISTREERKIKSISVGQREPCRLLLHAGLLYCANASGGSISRMRPDGDKRLTRCTGAGPQVMLAKKKKVYVICNESDSVWRYDTRAFMAETAAACGSWPVDVVAFGQKIAVANMMSCNICCFNEELHAEKPTSLDMIPLCLAVSVGQRLIVCGMESDEIGACRILDVNSKVVGAFSTPWPLSSVTPLQWQNAGIAISVWQNRLCKLDWDQKRIVWQIQTGRMPESVLIDEAMGRIYISCLQDGCIEIYDMSGQLRKRIATGREPRGMALGNVGKIG